METKERIATLDGLRALAAFGVLWIHAWTAHGNPRCYLFGVDLASVMAIGGNGVDLFFVISGFCMYFFYANRPGFTTTDTDISKKMVQAFTCVLCRYIGILANWAICTSFPIFSV